MKYLKRLALVVNLILFAMFSAPAFANSDFFHGGPVMLGTINVYYIWYGNWSGNTAKTILPAFIANLNGSSYWNTLATYRSAQGVHLSNSVKIAAQVSVGYPASASLTDADLRLEITRLIDAGRLPFDPNGIYVMLTSGDVQEFAAAGKQFCAPGGDGGYHNHFSMNGAEIKYAFVGDPDQQACKQSLDHLQSPNRNPGADSMASVLAHELAEAITDPMVGVDKGYYSNSQSAEVGDLCEASHGVARGPVNLHGHPYFLQPLPRNVNEVPSACVFGTN